MVSFDNIQAHKLKIEDEIILKLHKNYMTIQLSINIFELLHILKTITLKLLILTS